MENYELTPKKVSESAIDNYRVQVFPGDLNPLGKVFGGTVLAIADKTAAMVALEHGNACCVTAAIDSIVFLGPAELGEILVFQAAVNRVWNTSMEIGVKIFAKNFKTEERRHILSAYFTFVSVDENNKPKKIRPLISETDDEKRRYEEAEKRRQNRLKNR